MESQQHKQGLTAVSLAFGIWGIVVLFWKQLEHYGSVELILYRLLWGFAFGLALVSLRGTFPDYLAALRSARQLRIHLFNGLLITANWLAYVYAITHEHILEGSLAYFMVPILNTAMGFLLLKERLRPLQWIAITCASFGVLNEVIQFGRIPWLALIMAGTFAWYGMNKTKSELGPLTGLTLEITLMLPLAMIGFVWLFLSGQAVANPTQPGDWIWMMSTGLVTLTPLVLFAYGARRIQLTTIGVFQFLAPTIKFAIGVFVYHEPFTSSKLITFAFIWVALVLYLIHLFQRHKHPIDAPSAP